MSGKVQKFRCWKMKLKIRLEYSDKTLCFELKLFFQRLPEIFCRLYEHVHCIWKVCLTWFFALSLKIVPTRHTNQNFFTKNQKGWFSVTSIGTNVTIFWLEHKMAKPPYNYLAEIDTCFHVNPPIITLSGVLCFFVVLRRNVWRKCVMTFKSVVTTRCFSLSWIQ